ncbi:ABC transporter permease [Paenibacillus validus]|uniref:ABC transporter permease n=1 Tax=Paenibacillus validus TaxID=44253 RepID=A0A7X3CT19_9BACL|nr:MULTISPECIES: ABC transporter permease [Paenibacillus]MED4599816.1 ABC transporter permease [Paenibacillus validus]MED4604654.1 ABC transporter permease [Paenibacillus validus]MUG70632.1 ABC transporter permease [Paenibacillus validus]
MQSKDIKSKELISISRLSFPFHWRDYFVYIAFAIVLIFFAFTIAADGFFLPSNLFNIVRATTMISIMAIAMTFVISAGELDLSIGSITAFSALISAMAMNAGYGMAGGVIAGLLAGLLIGATNGILVTKVGIPSFLVTLGMMQLLRGVDMWLTNTNPVVIKNANFNFFFGSGNLGSIPVLLLWSLVFLGAGHYILKHTPFGREVLATGGNRLAAEYSGVNTKRIKFYAFLLSGGAAAIAGMLYAGMMQSARYSFGQGDELSAIAAVILGGTSLFGGAGTIIGTIIGSLLIGTINNGLIIMGLSVSQQMIVSGAIIILAVAFGKKPAS